MARFILLGFLITVSLTTCCSLEINCVCNDSCEERGLTEIPQCLPHSVKGILISRNNISRINESSFEKYDSLETVDISDNQLSNVGSGTFENTSKVTRIILRRNFINSMPTDLLKSLPKLEMFSVSENSIEEISETMFDRNVNLKSLYLYRNKLSRIGKFLFRYLKKLQRLNLSNNLIFSLHVDTFSGNPGLKEVFVAYNRIDHLDGKLFEHNAKLEYLDVSGNDLVALEAGMFKLNPLLMTLVMTDNPWHCDCHMKATMQELRERNIELDNIGKCWTPGTIGGDLSTLMTMNISCQISETNLQVIKSEKLCDDTNSNFTMVIVGGFIIILTQITICSFFAFYRYVVRKKAEERRENLMKRKSASCRNFYLRSSYEKPITNKSMADQNEYNYIVPTNNESLYACISENDSRYLTMTVYDKISPPQQQAEDFYTVMKPQNINLDNKYLTMNGKNSKYDNVR